MPSTGPTSRTPLRNAVTANTEPTASHRRGRRARRAADGAERTEHAARDDERRAAPAVRYGGERDRVGIAQQPIGEQDVHGVGGGRAERHPDPDRVGVHSGATDERDPGEDADEREDAAARQALATGQRGYADDEHEMGVVHERRERRRRPLERAVEERRVERVDDRAERERGESDPRPERAASCARRSRRAATAAAR